VDVRFTPHAWEEFNEWIDQAPEMAKRIRELINAIRRNQFKGIGKPEPLKYDLKGFWSRRISNEHRLVYRVIGKKGDDQRVEIVQCKFHY
jgi:toxin YoeB